jgi:hypothetical protein
MDPPTDRIPAFAPCGDREVNQSRIGSGQKPECRGLEAPASECCFSNILHADLALNFSQALFGIHEFRL